MGWKSTINLTRDVALKLINLRISKAYNMSDTELGDFLEELGFGDNPDLPFVGHNFIITDEPENIYGMHDWRETQF